MFYYDDKIGMYHIKYKDNADACPHCFEGDCMRAADNLCDFPVGQNLTCDAMICKVHSHEVNRAIHYCSAHAPIYKDFVESGNLEKALSSNIVNIF